MSLLLSSERVYSDLLDWIWFGEPEQVTRMLMGRAHILHGGPTF